jgi:hypothetical protein
MGFIVLKLKIQGTYLNVLRIPIEDCNRFAIKPLKWLRCIGFTIYGCEGDICTSSDGPPVDYGSQAHEGTEYFYVSPCTCIPVFLVGFMLIICLTVPHRLLDTHYIDDRTSDANTEGHAGFWAQVEARDGTCVVTGSPINHCDAVHYCPHSKGSEVSRLPVSFVAMSSHNICLSTSSA